MYDSLKNWLKTEWSVASFLGTLTGPSPLIVNFALLLSEFWRFGAWLFEKLIENGMVGGLFPGYCSKKHMFVMWLSDFCVCLSKLLKIVYFVTYPLRKRVDPSKQNTYLWPPSPQEAAQANDHSQPGVRQPAELETGFWRALWSNGKTSLKTLIWAHLWSR